MPTERVEPPPPEAADALVGGAAAVLRHERLPFVSYPYEWPFSMLRDAALLQLRLVREALDEDLSLKDASPYNVQWRGARPVFIDVGSFERLREGEAWAGYRQFCQLFLYPLMLQAYKDVPYHPWLRGAIDGIQPREARALMSVRDLLRPGVFAHVHLHARFDRRYAEAGGDEVRARTRRAGFSKDLIRANVARLEKIVQRLRWRAPETVWTAYRNATSYDDADTARKEAFVRDVAGSRRWGRVWDLGTNDGVFARIAADHADHVVAIDADHALLDAVYRRLADEGDARILPLVVDLGDASPGRGWRGRERLRLEDRGRPDLTLALALIHHLSIAGNVPLREVLDWLADLGGTLVLEWVSREDPMVRRLLAAKGDDAHPDYDTAQFERLLHERFDVARAEPLGSGTRTLYLAGPRGG